MDAPIPLSKQNGWTIQRIRNLVQAKFGKRPCWYQVKTALAIYDGKDVVGCAPTGAGKTLSFWIPLLMALEDGRDKLTVVVTPLNLLGKQNVDVLQEAGLPAIAVSKENANTGTFKDIENGKYRVVVINPEILMGSEEVEELWKKPHLTKRILNFIFDEGHCISQWSKFRKEYLLVGNLRLLISERIPFYIASATLPAAVLRDLIDILKLRPKEVEYIMYSNDRPDIRLMTRSLMFPASSFQDLAFLIPEDFSEGNDPLPPFLVFFDNTKEAEKACRFLRRRLPRALWTKINWFHSTMMQQYREEQVEAMKKGDVWGLCCTDAFGMGMDLPNIQVVVQWKATCDLCTLWQHFGRCARGPGQQGTAILLVDKKDTAEARQAKAERAAKKREKAAEGASGAKRKAREELHRGNAAAKRPVLGDRSSTRGELNIAISDIPDEGEQAADDELELSPTALKELKEERRILYADRSLVETTNAKGKGRDKELAVDDYINAKHVGFRCRRIVPSVYFDNDKRPSRSHLDCDSTTSSGCQRCGPQLSYGCCDLCSPEAFLSYFVSAGDKGPKTTNKSHIKPYKMSEGDLQLKASLRAWRQREALIKFLPSTIRTLGARILVSDNILRRIVDCAHAGKIRNINDLAKESGMSKDRLNDYGEELIRIILDCYPPPTAADMDGSSARKRAPIRCKACLGIGHNSSNRLCPVKRTRENSENIPPIVGPSHTQTAASSYYRPLPVNPPPSTS